MNQKASKKKSGVSKNDDVFGGPFLASTIPQLSEENPRLTASLGLKFGFGCTPCLTEVVQSFQSIKMKEESTDRLIFRMGKRMCIYDTDTDHISYLSGESKVIIDITHFHVSFNSKYVSVCEVLRSEKENEIKSQFSVYSLITLTKLNTCSYETSAKFICSSFCSETRYVAVLCSDEQQHQVMLFNWEKEKLYKISTFPAQMKPCTISCPPSLDTIFSVSGPFLLKLGYVGIDNSMKSSTLVPISKDKGERIIDQIWLNPQGNFQKLAVSVEFEAAEPHKRFAVYLFEATEESIFKENDQVSPTYEHRQTIQLSSEPHRSLKICRTIRSGKGFILVGDRGYVSVFDKSDEKKSSYREMYSLRLGDEENFIAAALVPSEEKLVVYSDRTSRLVSIPLSLISSKERGDQSVSSSPSDLTLNGFHSDSVIAADLSLQRPILVTVSADCTARVWNYETKKCDLVHEFGTEDPRAVAVHASGLQVLISFKDGVRLYNILRNSFKLYRETVLRSCQCVRFSSGCQFWAAASGLSVFVFDSKTFSQLASFPGHLNPVKELQWAPGDQAVFSSSTDGNVYGWDIATGNRVNINVATNQSSQISALAVMASSGLFPSDNKKAAPLPNFVAFATQDGNVRVTEWLLSDFGLSAATEKPRTPFGRDQLIDFYIPGDGINFITALIMVASKTFLVAGTKSGDLRLLNWNASPSQSQNVYLPAFAEVKAHSAPVIAIRETPTGGIVSVGEDGTIFIWSMDYLDRPERDADTDSLLALGENTATDTEGWVYNSGIVCLSSEDIEDHIATLDALNRQLSESQSMYEYTLRKMENDHGDKLRSLVSDHLQVLNAEKQKYETLYSAYNDKTKEAQKHDEANGIEHVKIVVNLENKFEKKLSEQLERYDALSEEMELLIQRNRAIKDHLEKKHREDMDSSRSKYEDQLRKFQADVKRLKEERAADEKAFKEILDQQEYEYEEELKVLIGASAQKLKEEREAHDLINEMTKSKLAKSKNTDAKLKDSNQTQRGLEAKLAAEKRKILNLNSTIAHYQANLKEREEALSEKEKVILELRNNAKTLENFRFVLDHRLQLLTAERGPITSHIEGLERHVTAMYEELVGEFESKKISQVYSDKKDQKMAVMAQEAALLKTEIKDLGEYAAAFKRELSNIVSTIAGGKEFEEAIKLLYRKYVIGDTIKGDALKSNAAIMLKTKDILETADDGFDDDYDGQNDTPRTKAEGSNKSRARMKAEVDAELIENAKEADRRRAFVEDNAKALKHRLNSNKRQAELDNKVRLAENSSLMYECNDLRWQVKDLERKLQVAEAAIEQSDKPKLEPSLLPNQSRAQRPNSNISLEMSRSSDKSFNIKGTSNIRKTVNKDDTSLSDSYDVPPMPYKRDLPKVEPPLKTRKVKEAQAERSVKRLTVELDALVLQLDSAHKEKEVYRMETNKLRQLVAQLQRTSTEDNAFQIYSQEAMSGLEYPPSGGSAQRALKKSVQMAAPSPFFEDGDDFLEPEGTIQIVGTSPATRLK